MTRCAGVFVAALALIVAFGAPMARGQSGIQLGDMNGAARPSSFVRFAAESQTVTARRLVDLELRFQIDPPYHINSHTPRSQFLIPTTLTVQPASGGVEIGEATFPAGHAYSFPFDPGNKVDVYSGSFIVKLRVKATPGEHTVNATLRYQACDNASCYPPKTLPVQILFTAK
jgi:hypothetical protein